MTETLMNFVNGQWQKSSASQHLEVHNPASAEVLGMVPLSPAAEVDQAAQAAAQAYAQWRRVPATQRIQYLFNLKVQMEEHFDELSRSVTIENGKVLDDARGEMRRAIENVEVACGIPTMMLGDFSEDIARGIDEYMIRQPVGVAAIIAPFNFPGMIQDMPGVASSEVTRRPAFPATRAIFRELPLGRSFHGLQDGLVDWLRRGCSFFRQQILSAQA